MKNGPKAVCIAALKKFPNFNSSLDGDHLVLKRYYNIAFAADTPQGLVVPVIKDNSKFFSAEGVTKANRTIKEITQTYNKDLLIETR